MRWLMLLTLLIVAPPAVGRTEPAAPSVPTRVEVVASGLNHPWSLAFLPDGSVLVTERNGGLRRIRNGRMTRIEGVPPVLNQGQGGLFDVLPDPDFERTGVIYLSYAHGTRRANGTRVARAALSGDRITDVDVIYTATPLKRGSVHFGGRMLFLPDNTLLVTTGDGFDFREKAQDLLSPLGKILRLDRRGRVPLDNPMARRTDALGAIWSYGHRNPQGLAWDPVRRVVYAHEHGPRGGDEVNLIVATGNYGWPIATHGLDYSGATISPFTEYPGMAGPLLHWTPSIAPSGLAVYRGAMFPEWTGDLLVGALVTREVRRVRLSPEGNVLGQESLFRHLGERIRDVRVAPDGAVWLTTDSPDGKVLRVSRAGQPG